jgi:Tfp pilus assembly protein PilZ
MREERRSDERVAMSMEARWEGMSGSYTARVGDISLGGCFIDTTGPVTAGELISFEIKLPDGTWLPLRGEVAFVQPNIGFSLSFSFLTEEEETALLHIMNS